MGAAVSGSVDTGAIRHVLVLTTVPKRLSGTAPDVVRHRAVMHGFGPTVVRAARSRCRTWSRDRKSVV
jgi:hypothetical protein